MKNKKVFGKALSMLLCTMLIFTQTANVFADSWTVLKPGASGYVYYYGGVKNDPDGTTGSVNIYGPYYDSSNGNYYLKSQNVTIHQYALNNIQDSKLIYTYCSDLAVIPTPNIDRVDQNMYSRIQIEQITNADQYFFKAGSRTVEQTANILRAILINSDLWYKQDTTKTTAESVAALSNASGVTGLTENDIMVATQLAVWHVVNGANPTFNAETNIKRYYNYLIGLTGMSAGEMATLKPVAVKKTGSTNGYQAEIKFDIVGTGADATVSFDGAKPNSFVDSVTYTVGGGDPVSTTNYTASGDTVTVKNIPNGATIEVIAKTKAEVTNVYLYSTRLRSNSQTLVSVEKEVIDLKTQVNIDPITEYAKLFISKQWTSDGYPLSNNVAADHKALFKVTYADPGDLNPDGTVKEGTFYGTEVTEIEITGNNSFTTADIFEKDRVYKIVETKVDGAEVATNPLTKYFTVKYIDNQYVVRWCDATGKIDGTTQSGTFTNDVQFEKGAVSVSKTVVNALTGRDDTFTFTVYYTPSLSGSEETKFVNAYYTINGVGGYTTSDGTFTLKNGQTAIFDALPKGATLKFVESGRTNYVVTPSDTQSAVVAAGNAETAKAINFTNTYQTGLLKISKEIAGVSSISWDNFPNAANGIDFTIKGTDGFEKVVTLYKGHTSEEDIIVPVGNYTVTEKTETGAHSATVTGYNVVVTSTGESGTIEKDKKSAAAFTNTYSRGQLTITKTRTYLIDGLNAEQQAAVKGKQIFTFTLHKDSASNPAVKLKLENGYYIPSDSGSTTITIDVKSGNDGATGAAIIKDLPTGTYYLVEDSSADISGVRLTKSGTGVSAFTVGSDTKVTFKNHYTKPSATLTVKKVVNGGGTGASDKTFTITATNTDTAEKLTFTLNKGNSWTGKNESVTPGAYTITETDVSVDNYGLPVVSFSGDGVTNGNAYTLTLNDGNDKTIMVTNTYTRQIGSVSFEKKVENGAFGDTFAFTATVGETLTTDQKNSIAVSGGTKGTWSGNTLNITGVAAGATVVISNLPAGAAVTVVEKLTDNQKQYYTVNPTNGTLSGLASVSSETPTNLGVITNTRSNANVNLTVKKTLENASWSSFPGGIKFTITGPEDWGDKFLDGATKINNFTKDASNKTKYYLVVYNGSAVSFNGIPTGVYSVLEDVTSATLNNHTRETWYNIGSGNVKLTGALEVSNQVLVGAKTMEFINKYTQKVGTGEFTKTFDYAPNKTDRFVFEFAFKTGGVTGTPIKVSDSVTINELGLGNINTSNESCYSWNAEGTVLTLLLTGATSYGTINLLGIPEGVSCTVTEILESTGNYNLTGMSASGTITNQNTIKLALKNTRKAIGQLTVEKTATGDDGEDFNFEIKVNGVLFAGKYKVDGIGTELTATGGKFKLKAGHSAVFTGLPLGVSYTVAETGATYYSTIVTSGSGIITAESAVTVNNTRKADGQLKVAKALDGDANGLYSDQVFTFKLERQSLSSSAIWIPVSTTGTDANGMFTITGAGVKNFTNLPHGNYRVTEQTTGVTVGANITWIVKNGNTDITSTKQIGSFSVNATNQTKTFTNDFTYKKSSLKVTKAVTAATAPWDIQFPLSTKEFTFTLYKGSIAQGNVYKTTGAPDGKFTLKNGEEITFNKLPYDVYYVVEDAATETGFSGPVVKYNDVDAGSVTINAPSAYTMNVTNTYTRESGSLTINKEYAEGSDYDTQEGFTFKLYRQVGSEWTLVTGLTGMDASGNFTVQSGDDVTFENLPLGTYKVVEMNAEKSGYSLEVTYNNESDPDDSAVTLISGTPGTIDVINMYTELFGGLTISKILAEDADTVKLAGTNWVYNFEIIGGIPNWGKDIAGLTVDQADNMKYTFNLSKTNNDIVLADIPIGEYTLTEIGGTGTDDTRYTWATAITGGAVNLTDRQTTVTVTDNTATGYTIQTAEFGNSFTRTAAELVISKLFDGTRMTSSVAGAKEFTFEIVGPDDFEETVVLSADTALFKRFEKAPSGVYYIRELMNNIDNITGYSYKGTTFGGNCTLVTEGEYEGWYTFTISGDSGKVDINCTNTYDKDGAEVRVTKAVDGYADGRSFDFRMMGATIPEGRMIFYKIGADGAYIPKTDPISGAIVIDSESGDPVRESYNAEYVAGGLSFSLQAGETAVFRGMDPAATYTVSEIIDDADDYFSFVKVEGGKFTFTNDGEVSEVIAFEDIDASTVNGKEISAKTGEKSNADGKKLFPGIHFTFTNKHLEGEMSINKIVEGQLYNDNPFTFYVSFKDGTEEDAASVDANEFVNLAGESTIAVTITDKVDVARAGDINISSTGELIITLADGETATITGLPRGVYYTVTEDTSGDKNGDFYYGVGRENAEDVQITGEPASCTITNARSYGKINIEKVVFPAPELSDEEFEVRVTFENGIDWAEGTAENDDMFDCIGAEATKEVSGKKLSVTFLIKHGEMVSIEKIPVGCTYEIEEPGLDTSTYKMWIPDADYKVNAPATTIGSKDESETDRIVIYNFRIPTDSLIVTKADVIAIEGSRLNTEKFDFILSFLEPGESSDYNMARIEQQKIIVEEKLLELSAIENNARYNDGVTDEDVEAYRQLLDDLDRATADYEKACEDRINEYNDYDNHPELFIECTSCEGDGLVDCDLCDGTGIITTEEPCTCERPDPDCELCGGSGTTEEGDPCSCNLPDPDCDKCDGTGTITTEDPCACDGSLQLECDTCNGTGWMVDQASLDIVLEGEKTNYEGIAGGLIASINGVLQAVKDLSDALELIDNFTKIQSKLSTGIYVEFEDDGTITLEQIEAVPLQIDLDTQVNAYDKNGDPINVSVTETEPGVYSFSLAKGEFLEITGLPEGTIYTVTEVRPTGLSNEAFLGATVNCLHDGNCDCNPGEDDNGTWLTGGVQLNVEDYNGNLISFTNEFAIPKGSLTVEKVWNNGRRAIPESVQVVLTINGVPSTVPAHTQTLTGPDWSYTFTGLTLGYTYGVKEVSVPTGYYATYSTAGVELSYEKRDGKITITNSTTRPDRNRDRDRDRDRDTSTTIPDGDTPLIEKAPVVREPDMVIADPGVPLADVPQTGTGDDIAFNMMMLGFSLSALLALLFGRKRKEEQR